MNKKLYESQTRLYHIWNGMRGRCLRKTSHNYKNYGGRGIKITGEWDSYKAFKEWALENGYREDLTLDRIDNNGDYEANNCRWVTLKDQENNRNNNKKIEYDGKILTVTQWAELLNINAQTIYTRLRRGWSIEKTFTKIVKGGVYH